MKRFFFLLLVLAAPAAAFAVNVSVPIPTDSNPTGVTSFTSFGEYIKTIYLFGIVLGAFVAVGTIVFAGIKYAASRGNVGTIDDAKKMIMDALWGLLLLLGVYLILTFINPDLVKLDVSVGTPITPGPTQNLTQQAAASLTPQTPSPNPPPPMQSSWGQTIESAGSFGAAMTQRGSNVQTLYDQYKAGNITDIGVRLALEQMKIGVDTYHSIDLVNQLKYNYPSTYQSDADAAAEAHRQKENFYKTQVDQWRPRQQGAARNRNDRGFAEFNRVFSSVFHPSP